DHHLALLAHQRRAPAPASGLLVEQVAFERCERVERQPPLRAARRLRAQDQRLGAARVRRRADGSRRPAAGPGQAQALKLESVWGNGREAAGSGGSGYLASVPSKVNLTSAVPLAATVTSAVFMPYFA